MANRTLPSLWQYLRRLAGASRHAEGERLASLGRIDDDAGSRFRNPPKKRPLTAYGGSSY
jgi:hypothetical protein